MSRSLPGGLVRVEELFHHIPLLNESIHPKWNLDAILSVLTGSGHHAVDGPVPTPSHNMTA